MMSATPRLDAVQAEINSLGYGTPEYHEAMWMLLSVMARRQAIMADHLRMSQRRRERAAATRAANKTMCRRCGNPLGDAFDSDDHTCPTPPEVSQSDG